MTVNSSVAAAVDRGDGVSTVFTVPFYFLADGDIIVQLFDISTGAETDLTLGTHYTVQGAGNQSGGSVTLAVAPPDTHDIRRARNVTIDQQVDYTPNDKFPAEVTEQALDKLTMICQQIDSTRTHAVRFNDYENIDGLLPQPLQRANTAYTFDANGFPQFAPLPSALGAGDMRLDTFVAGVDFTPGVTTTLNLSRAPLSGSNTWANFDDSEQFDFTLSGASITFTDGQVPPNPIPIPVGITKVRVRSGTTLSVGMPAQQSVTNDSVADGAGIESDKLLYVPPWVGAAPRIVTNRLADRADIRDWDVGAGSGDNDDTSAMQKAHASGQLIHYGKGTFVLEDTVSMAAGGIVGAGIGQTVLQFTDTGSKDAINWTSSGGGIGSFTPLFRDFAINGSLAKTLGSAITVDASPMSTSFALFDNVSIENMPIGFNLLRASFWKIRGCNALNYLHWAVNIANNFLNDEGDSSISDCVFNTAVDGDSQQAGVNYQSSGGLKVTNTKILGGMNSLVVSYDGATSTSILLLANNSFETNPALGGFGVFIGRVSGSGSFGRIFITGNEIAGANGINIGNAGVTGFSDQIGITGNNIVANGGAWGLLLQGVSNFNIGTNTIQCVSPSSTGVMVDANCVNGHVDPQIISGALSGANKIVNQSASTTVSGRKQKGTTSGVVCGTGYGSLFQGAAAVAFAVPYAVAPNISDIKCSPHDTSGGGVAAYATNPTTTGFTMVAISATNGGAVACNWEAEGII
jgi:LysM repeat protein